MTNLVDFTNEEISRAVHRMDADSDSFEGADVRAWNTMRSMLISNCEQLRGVDEDDRRSELAIEICDKTADAYSFDCYGRDRWMENIQELTIAGYNDIAVEWIVRSKIARWANSEETTMLNYIRCHIGDVKLREMMREK